MKLPRYRSHRIVEAAPIEFTTDTGVHVAVGGTVYGVDVPPEFFARGRPDKGDYLVVYAPDGYLSWSPREKFEEGYALIAP